MLLHPLIIDLINMQCFLKIHMSKDILQTLDLNFPEVDLSPAFRILLCTICTVSMCSPPSEKADCIFAVQYAFGRHVLQ